MELKIGNRVRSDDRSSFVAKFSIKNDRIMEIMAKNKIIAKITILVENGENS